METPTTTETPNARVAELESYCRDLLRERAAVDASVIQLEVQNAELRAEVQRLRAAEKTAQDRAIEMMANVGQSSPVPPDPKQTAQPKKTLTERAREKLGL